jgi:hypothetical protein
VQGIYRENGSQNRIEGFEYAVDNGVDFDFQDPHTAASVLKRFCRRAPEPVLLYSNLAALKALFVRGSDLDAPALKRFQRLIAGLPITHFLLLAYWFRHLLVVRTHAGTNLMGIPQLAVCVAPSMIWTETDDAGVSDATLQVSVATALLEHYDEVFGANPVLRYGACGAQGFATLLEEQDDSAEFALVAPVGAIVQVIAQDRFGWAICVYNDSWGAVHSRFLTAIEDPKAIAAAMALQDKKWTLPPEEIERIAICPEAGELYREISAKLAAARERLRGG